jgi:hypothetical protein
MKRFWTGARVAAASAALLSTPGCVPADAESSPYLLVSPAADQAASPALGTVVVLQQRGGTFLRMKTQAGKYFLPSDSPSGSGHDLFCIPAPTEDSLFFFDVVPSETESLLYVDLLGPNSKGIDCDGKVLATMIVPITTKRDNPPPASTTAAATTGTGATGTGGMGTGGMGTGGMGTTATSTGAGGAGGG